MKFQEMTYFPQKHHQQPEILCSPTSLTYNKVQPYISDVNYQCKQKKSVYYIQILHTSTYLNETSINICTFVEVSKLIHFRYVPLSKYREQILILNSNVLTLPYEFTTATKTTLCAY